MKKFPAFLFLKEHFYRFFEHRELLPQLNISMFIIIIIIIIITFNIHVFSSILVFSCFFKIFITTHSVSQRVKTSAKVKWQLVNG